MVRVVKPEPAEDSADICLCYATADRPACALHRLEACATEACATEACATRQLRAI